MKKERWRSIPAWLTREPADLNGYYVSALGRVRYWGSMFELPRYVSARGYPQVWVKGRRLDVRRLVAAAFIGFCPQGQVVTNRNRIKTDDRAMNLEYVTRSELRRRDWAARKAWSSTSSSRISRNRIWRDDDD